MKKLKSNWNGIVLCLFEIVVGILLLINPVGFTAGIIASAGIVLMVLGLVSVVKYFKKDAAEAAMGQYLTKGLILLVAGGFCTFRADWFIVTFPAITLLYGVVVLITGLGKIQLTVDMLRKKSKKWFLATISAIVSIACGIVILNNPFASTAVLWTFTGIALIVEAVIDLVTLIISKKEQKAESTQ